MFSQKKGVLVLKMVGSITPSHMAHGKCFAWHLAQRSLRGGRESTTVGIGTLWRLSCVCKT